MPYKIPDNTRETIKIKLCLAQTLKQIEKHTHTSHRSIQRFSKNLRDYGSVRPPKIVPQGRPRVITPQMQEVCPQIPISIITRYSLLGPSCISCSTSFHVYWWASLLSMGYIRYSSWCSVHSMHAETWKMVQKKGRLLYCFLWHSWLNF